MLCFTGVELAVRIPEADLGPACSQPPPGSFSTQTTRICLKHECDLGPRAAKPSRAPSHPPSRGQVLLFGISGQPAPDLLPVSPPLASCQRLLAATLHWSRNCPRQPRGVCSCCLPTPRLSLSRPPHLHHPMPKCP